MKYHHLTRENRYQIAALLSMNLAKDEIASRLKVHRATIFREIKRNREKSNYRPQLAHTKTKERRAAKGRASRKIQGSLKQLIEMKLRLGWSPEQIAGRLKFEGKFSISHETIYQHILRDCKAGGSLRYTLRFRGYKYHRFRKSRYALRNRLSRPSLKQRPIEANERKERGHWERDLVIGKKGGASLLTIVDRKSRYVLIKWIKKPTAAAVARATNDALRPFQKMSKTMTNDNGVEFGEPHRISVPVYFTEPAAPWQRGSVENLNGLVRQYFRKKSSLESYPDWIGQALEETLNHRPRKIHNYQTPHEVHMNEKTSLLESHFGLKTNKIS